MQIKATLTITDLLQILTLQKKELEQAVLNHDLYNTSSILSGIYGGLHRGFLEMKANEIKERYNVSFTSQAMDVNILKYYIDMLNIMIDFLNNNKIAKLDNNHAMACYEKAIEVGIRARKKFIEQHKCKPHTYLDNIYLKRKKEKLTSGEVTLKINANEELQTKLINQISVMNNINLTDEEINEVYKRLKKQINSIIYNRYQDVKGFGRITNKIYLSFYGKNADEILTALKENDIKKTSVYEAQDKTHQIYYLAALRILLENLKQIPDNSMNYIKYKAYVIGENLKLLFIEKNKNLPINDLIEKNKPAQKNQTPEKECYQMSLFDEHPVRQRKKSMYDYYEELLEKEERP